MHTFLVCFSCGCVTGPVVTSYTVLYGNKVYDQTIQLLTVKSPLEQVKEPYGNLDMVTCRPYNPGQVDGILRIFFLL